MNSVNQQGASAVGDIIAGSKFTLHQAPNTQVGIVEQLLIKLQAEMKDRDEIRHMVENLQFFYQKKSIDGIEGLQAKLEAASRSNELYLAFEKKELFVKLLDKWSMYASAQEIFAYLLAKIEYEFSTFVHPYVDTLDPHAINELVNHRIILPTIVECGSGAFSLNHIVVMGMIYWLAEQCFVRWHK
jgi:ABC-3C protein